MIALKVGKQYNTGMSQVEIENAILNALYESWYLSDEAVQLVSVRERDGWDKKIFQKTESKLERAGLIRARGIITHEITPKGIIVAEQNGVVSQELSQKNIDARTKLFLALGDLYDDEGSMEYSHYTTLASKHSLDEEIALRNLEVLSK